MTTTVLPPSTSWSMRDVRRVFMQLSAPDLQELAGHWDGAFIGRPRLRRLTTAIVAVTPLRGWCGKKIGQSGDVHNLVRRGRGVVESVGATAGRGVSLLDGQPAMIVDYSRTAKPPGSWGTRRVAVAPAQPGDSRLAHHSAGKAPHRAVPLPPEQIR